jgi:hypothetical protein
VGGWEGGREGEGGGGGALPRPPGGGGDEVPPPLRILTKKKLFSLSLSSLCCVIYPYPLKVSLSPQLKTT